MDSAHPGWVRYDDTDSDGTHTMTAWAQLLGDKLATTSGGQQKLFPIDEHLDGEKDCMVVVTHDFCPTCPEFFELLQKLKPEMAAKGPSIGSRQTRVIPIGTDRPASAPRIRGFGTAPRAAARCIVRAAGLSSAHGRRFGVYAQNLGWQELAAATGGLPTADADILSTSSARPQDKVSSLARQCEQRPPLADATQCSTCCLLGNRAAVYSQRPLKAHRPP